MLAAKKNNQVEDVQAEDEQAAEEEQAAEDEPAGEERVEETPDNGSEIQIQ